MLEELSISNVALIDRLAVKFTAGMNVLSGETGAGKSILAGALGLIRGDKGELDLIRSGTEEAVVSATFSLPENSELLAWLAERGLEPEAGHLFLRRVLRRTGKASIYIQGISSSLKDLTELSSMLFDMHGQHEHQSLFLVDNHRIMLDSFGALTEEAEDFYRLFGRMAALIKQRERLLENERDRQRQQEYLAFAVRELDEARLVEGEDETLESERRVLNQSEKLFSQLAQSSTALTDEDGGAHNRLYAAKQGLHEASQIDPSLGELAGRLENIYYEIDDIAAALQSYQDRAVFDPARIDAIEDRLALIQRLKKKYGNSLAEIIAYRDTAEQELSQLENYDQNLAELNASIKDCETQVLNSATELSKKRRAAALRLKAAVESGLRSLSMEKTVFEISFKQKESERGTPVCGPYGFDAIEFLLSANPGEPLKPLKNVASGGEISRIMLAIKAALADSDKVDVLVFDEVDTGIGGEVAVALGEHLHKLSRNKQILAITHLASIAVRADNHLRVEKVEREGRTFTHVENVEGPARVEEIARMLSGDRTGDASLSYARDLLGKFHVVYQDSAIR